MPPTSCLPGSAWTVRPFSRTALDGSMAFAPATGRYQSRPRLYCSAGNGGRSSRAISIPRHVAQANDRTILRCFQDNIAKLFFGMQAATGVNGDQESLSFGSGSAQADRRRPVRFAPAIAVTTSGRSAPRRRFIRVSQTRIAYSPEPKIWIWPTPGRRQLVLHLQRGVVTHIQ